MGIVMGMVILLPGCLTRVWNLIGVVGLEIDEGNVTTVNWGSGIDESSRWGEVDLNGCFASSRYLDRVGTESCTGRLVLNDISRIVGEERRWVFWLRVKCNAGPVGDVEVQLFTAGIGECDLELRLEVAGVVQGELVRAESHFGVHKFVGVNDTSTLLSNWCK